jgi:hypothetical protein
VVSARRAAWLLPALLAFAFAVAALAAPPHAMAPAEKVNGKRVDAYPALWWQWVNRKRWGAQAFQDPTGAQCALNQSGPVWFLAGTDGTDAFKRHCRVPTGKHVFLPLITMLANAVPGQDRPCGLLKAEAADNNNHLVATKVSVDGVRIDIQALRMAGACFNAYEHADYLKKDSAGQLSATDGYWLMLAPFADGAHTIKVRVRYDNPGATLGDMDQDFEYELDVGGAEPPPAPDPDDEDGEDWRQA